jgi:hypothetical protein
VEKVPLLSGEGCILATPDAIIRIQNTLLFSSQCWQRLIVLLRETEQLIVPQSCTISNTKQSGGIMITLVTEISNKFSLH